MLTPKIEYLYGYKVEAIQSSDHEWEMLFNNGAIISSQEGPTPDNLEGWALVMSTLSATETVLVFKKGNDSSKVILTPGKYSVTDPRLPQEESESDSQATEADDEGEEPSDETEA